jgi:thiamine biosynthesis lipoprotein
MKPLWGTFLEINIEHGEYNAEEVLFEIFKFARSYQDKLSFHDVNSEISRLNRSFLDLKFVKLSSETMLALRLARKMTKASNKLFDMTCGGRMIQLGILPNHIKVPFYSFGELSDVEIIGTRARLINPIQITLDGISKGLGVDLIVKKLKELGVNNGWVNAGGDLKVFGSVAIPIQRREICRNFTILGMLKNEAIATSTVFSKKNDVFPGMIVSYVEQSENFNQTFTIKSRSAWLADALTKVAANSKKIDRHKNVNLLFGNWIE